MRLNYTKLKLLPYLMNYIGNIKLKLSPLSKHYSSNSYNIEETIVNPKTKEATEANTSLLNESSKIAPTILYGNILTPSRKVEVHF
jgi:hypothetical protein